MKSLKVQELACYTTQCALFIKKYVVITWNVPNIFLVITWNVAVITRNVHYNTECAL